MSTTQIRPVYDLGVAADYLEHGFGSKKKGHLAQGTNRVAPGSYVDAASIEQFIALGNQLAATHHRRVKAHSIIVAFHPDELDVTDPDDLQRGGDLAYLVAKEAFPNSPAMVIVHDDADGGHVHAHVTVLNHDLQTGRAPTKNRNHAAIRTINDRVMVEQGMSTATPYAAERKSWPDRRVELVDDPFALKLGDAAAEARRSGLSGDLDRFDEVFDAECAARGVRVTRTTHKVETDSRRGHRKGDELVGITFSAMEDPEPGYSPRERRRKASKLSSEFTATGLQQAVEAERRRRVAEAHRLAVAAERQRQAALAAQAQPAQQQPVDDPIMAKMRRVLNGQPPEVVEQPDPTGEAEPDQASLATAPDAPPALATAPAVDDQQTEADQGGTRSAPATTGEPLAAAPGTPTGVYRSRLWDYPATTTSERQTADKLAVLDEWGYAELAEGRRLDDARIAEVQVGKTKLDKYGDYFDPGVLAELRARVAKKARATELVQSDDEHRRQRGFELRRQIAEGIYDDVPDQDDRPRRLSARERLLVEMEEQVETHRVEDERSL